ncbi:MAG: hypothetical protein GXO78_12465 [Calditrichaeota bacterium]|nr:hypothetical protein [Calditrichota bacterium]
MTGVARQRFFQWIRDGIIYGLPTLSPLPRLATIPASLRHIRRTIRRRP